MASPLRTATTGISKNTLAKGNYTVTPSGNYKVTLKAQPKAPKAEQRVFRSAATTDAQRAADARVIAEDNARQQVQRDYENQRRELLNQAITGEALFRDARDRAGAIGTDAMMPKDYSGTSDYQANRNANYDNAAAYQTNLAALKAQQAAAEAARFKAEQEQRLNQREARSRITNADSDLARQSLLDDRIRYYRSTGMSQAEAENAALNRPWETMNADYLKKIGLDAGNGSLYGVGSSNFNPNTGEFQATMDDRRQLKQDRYDLANTNKYDDLIAQGAFSPSGTGLEKYGAAGNVSQPAIVSSPKGSDRSLPEPPVQSPTFSSPANAAYSGSIPTNIAFTNPGTAAQQTANIMPTYSSFGTSMTGMQGAENQPGTGRAAGTRVRRAATGAQFTGSSGSRSRSA